MVQGFKSGRVFKSGEADAIQAFADRQRLKTRFDDDGTRIISGKFGQIYEYGGGPSGRDGHAPYTPQESLGTN